MHAVQFLINLIVELCLSAKNVIHTQKSSVPRCKVPDRTGMLVIYSYQSSVIQINIIPHM
jgi:predicted carbohydrate-binding protein with CBM5 and CBM33 domain